MNRSPSSNRNLSYGEKSPKQCRSKSRSTSRNRPRFSFRDMDPYSKTKSISINKRKSTSSPWDEKENVDSNIDKRPRSISNESPLRKSTNNDYKVRKSEIIEGLKSAYERKMNNLPRHINPKTYVKDCQTQDIEKIIKIEMEVPYN